MTDWDSVTDLGKVLDSELAVRFNVSRMAVFAARKRRGIPPFSTPSPRYTIDWDSVPLGEFIDQHIADMLGCSNILVHKERTKRGIPPHGLLYRTQENQGAYYGEAIIDAWLHNHNLQHTFQKKIGPYRVDWLLENNEVWEFLGMWGHLLYGDEYQQNYEKKKAYLTELGFSVRGIHKSELLSFKEGVDLKSLHSMRKFVCLGCHRSNVKHSAHSMCSVCAHRSREGKEPGPVTERLKPYEYFQCKNCKSEDRRKSAKGLCSKCYTKSRSKAL